MTGRIARAVLKWLTCCSAVWLALFLLDNAAGLTNGLRLFFSFTASIFSVYTFVVFVGKAVVRWPTLEQMALILESRYGIERNLLINSLQLGRHRHTGSAAQFAHRMVDQGKQKARQIPLPRILEPAQLARWAATTIVVLGMWGTYQHRAPLRLYNAAVRYARPLAEIQPLGRACLHVYPNANLTVTENENLEIIAILENGSENPLPPEDFKAISPRILILPETALMSRQTDAEHGLPMLPITHSETLAALAGHPHIGRGAEDRAFKYIVHRIKTPFTYRVFSPRARISSSTLQVGVFRKPRITASRFIVTPPDYTGAAPLSMPGPPELLSGLAGSGVRIEVTLDQEVDRLLWTSSTNRTEFGFGDKQSKEGAAETTLRTPGEYAIDAEVTRLTGPLPIAAGRVQLRDDLPPHVEILGELQRRDLIPGQNLELDIVAADDFGLAQLSVTMRRPEGGNVTTLRSRELGPPPGITGTFRQRLRISLVPSLFPPGGDYIVEAVCNDFCPEGHEVRSTPLLIGIQPVPRTPAPGAGPAMIATCEALNRAIEAQERALGVSRNMIQYLDEILEEESRDPAGENSFLQHESALSKLQSNVASHLDEAITAAAGIPPPAPPFAKPLRAIRQYPAKQALDMTLSLGQVEDWLDKDQAVLHRGEFVNSNAVQTAIFPETTGRYAILQAQSTVSNLPVTIAELSFLDRDMQPFARQFVQNWQIAPMTNGWDPDEGFTPLGKNDIRNILNAATQAPMTRAKGPRVDLTQFVPGARGESLSWYAAREISVDGPQEIRMLTGSSDFLRVWLNGWLVTEVRTLRKVRPDEDETRIRLEPGSNTLLVEASNATGDSALYLRFVDKDGKPLALSDTGSLHPAPQWKVAHVHRPNQEYSPSHAIDNDPATYWQGFGTMPQGIIIDLGTEETLTGLRYLSHHGAPGTGIERYDVTLTSTLSAHKILPRRLNALIMIQTVILDRLMAIRGEEVGQQESIPEKRTKEGPQDSGASVPGEEALNTAQAVELFLDDLDRFEKTSHEISEARSELLDQAEDARRQQADKLDELRHKDMRLAADLATATADLGKVPNNETAPPEQQAALQKMKSSSEQLSDLADRKASLPADQKSESIDRAMDELCREIQKSGQLAAASTPTGTSSEATTDDAGAKAPETAKTTDQLDELTAELDRRERALRDTIESIESSLTSRNAEEGPAAPGDVQSVGEGSKDGDARSEERSDTQSRAEMGKNGRADGKATGDAAGDAPASGNTPGERPSDSKAHDGSIKEAADAPGETSTGLGTEMDTATEFGSAGRLTPEILDQIKNAYQEQKQIRESARSAANSLKRYNLPTAEFEMAIAAMTRVEAALQQTDALELKRAYEEAADLTSNARRLVSERVGLQYLRSRTSARSSHRLHISGRSAPPEGYEEMVGAYFRKLADQASE